MVEGGHKSHGSGEAAFHKEGACGQEVLDALKRKPRGGGLAVQRKELPRQVHAVHKEGACGQEVLDALKRKPHGGGLAAQRKEPPREVHVV